MTVYTQHGPYVSGVGPGLDAGLFNDIESVLLGSLGMQTVQLTIGTLTRISKFTGTGTGASQVVSHGLGANPDIILIQYAGNFGGPPSNPPFYFNTTTTQVTIHADSGFSWNALAIKF